MNKEKCLDDEVVNLANHVWLTKLKQFKLSTLLHGYTHPFDE